MIVANIGMILQAVHGDSIRIERNEIFGTVAVIIEMMTTNAAMIGIAEAEVVAAAMSANGKLKIKHNMTNLR